MHPQRTIGFVLLVALLAGCGGASTVGPNAPDSSAAATQAKSFVTYATANKWGNYGEEFTQFCEQKFGFDCNRPDRSQGEDLLSAQEIEKFDAEKNNPVAALADIGILFMGQAQTAGVLADYQPPNATMLPAELHGPGWVTTFVGVPAVLVNATFLQAHGLPIPHSWHDLLNPAYKSMIGLSRVGVSGSATWAFLAMNLAAGGTVSDFSPGVAYAKQLLPNLTDQATIDTFEKGETPISVRYDFNHATWLDQLRTDGIDAQLIIPTDGSVYSPETLMLNRYDVAHADFGKLFMDWVLTDEGQELFAKFGSRPIRSVVGDNRLVVPADLRVNWLPDEAYAPVQTIDFRAIDSDHLADIWQNQVLAGS
jgi:putative spermidine/putrescine transport system substrate-binding protein